MNELNNITREQTKKAQRLYHERYNNGAYCKATQGKSIRYANALIDAALALCGSPYHKLTGRRWGKDALAFLALFEQENEVDAWRRELWKWFTRDRRTWTYEKVAGYSVHALAADCKSIMRARVSDAPPADPSGFVPTPLGAAKDLQIHARKMAVRTTRPYDERG